MVIPLPTSLLDLLIVANLSISMLILLVSMNVRRALDFSSFPSLLLVVTLFRLGLNVATSRAVLVERARRRRDRHLRLGRRRRQPRRRPRHLPDPHPRPVRRHLERFRARRRGDRPLHARRDARQADGDRRRPQRRRSSTTHRPSGAARTSRDEADFYGAMDGASKFVKGDAIAGLVITMVNLIGGFLIGVVQSGMSIGEAITTYSLLSIGDGLVAADPGAARVDLGRSDRHPSADGAGDLGSDVFAQFGGQRQAVRAAGGRRPADGPRPRPARRSRSSSWASALLVIGGSAAGATDVRRADGRAAARRACGTAVAAADGHRRTRPSRSSWTSPTT